MCGIANFSSSCTHIPGIGKAFAPAVRGRALIAAGVGELHGPATVAVWNYAEKGTQPMVTLVKIGRLIPTVSPHQPPLSTPYRLTTATTATNLDPNLDEYWIVIPLLGVVDPLTLRRKWMRTDPQFLMMNLRYHTKAYFGFFFCVEVPFARTLSIIRKKSDSEDHGAGMIM